MMRLHEITNRLMDEHEAAHPTHTHYCRECHEPIRECSLNWAICQYAQAESCARCSPPDWKAICDEHPKTVWPPSTCVECGERIPSGTMQRCEKGGWCNWYVPAAVQSRMEQMHDEQQGRPYPLCNVLGAGRNVSHRKPWYAKVDWRGVRDGALIAAGGLLLAVLLVGCKCCLIEKPGHNRAVYVRDSSHHCKAESKQGPHESWNLFADKPEAESGYTYYACDNGMSLIIRDDEEQP